MNLLELVPAFKRHVRQYVTSEFTDSKLAAYLADSIEALNIRWTRTYVITYTSPETYEVSPSITAADKRPVILMASIIFKSGTSDDTASYRDGDFAYDPASGRQGKGSTDRDIDELEKILPVGPKLAKAVSASMRGFNNVYNPESYVWGKYAGVAGSVTEN